MADEDEQASGDVWGDDISEERKAYLEQRLQAWEQEANHGKRKGPFDDGPDEIGVPLTGADVFWLAARTAMASGDETAITHAKAILNDKRFRPAVTELHLEGAVLHGAHLEGPPSARRAWRGPTSPRRHSTRPPACLVPC